MRIGKHASLGGVSNSLSEAHHEYELQPFSSRLGQQQNWFIEKSYGEVKVFSKVSQETILARKKKMLIREMGS